MKMKSIVAATALSSFSLLGCLQPQDQHPVADAIPRAEQVRIDLPADGAREIGQLAPWYGVTRGVTLTLNGGTAWVLVLVHLIVQQPPTSVRENTATWGPGSDPLDPANYRLDVTNLGNGTYDWELSADSKSEPGETWEVLIAGNAAPGARDGEGSGDFSIDFDAIRRVDPFSGEDARGVVSVNYDLDRRHLDMAISTVEDRAGTPTPVFYDYTYDEAADRSGNMTFAIHADSDDAGTLAEDAELRSRWKATGAGRADLRLSGGDLQGLQVSAVECWDTAFRRVYYTDSVQWQPTEGNAADCAYTDVSLPPSQGQ
jgi:hypothetical protein